MAISKITGVEWNSIAKVGLTAKANVAKVGGTDAPAGGTITWGVVGQDGSTGYALSTAISGNSNWSGYRDPNSTSDCNWMAYGKDGNGDELWIKGSGDNNREMMCSTDITSDGTWNSINLINPADKNRIIWAKHEELWVACGQMASDTDYSYHTSSVGTSSWGAVSLSGVTTATATIRGLATNGSGSWIICQDDKVFCSNNLAAGSAGWSLLNDFSDTRDIIMAGYAASRWFITYRDFKPGGGDGEGVASAPAADSGSWTDSADINIGGAIPTSKQSGYANSTASSAEATIIIVNASTYSRSTNSGVLFQKHASELPFGDARAVATDGKGNWMVTHDDSKCSYSSNDGESFEAVKNGATVSNGGWGSGGNSDIDGVAASVFLPHT